MKYRRKPQIVDAFQLDDDTYDRIVDHYDFSRLPKWFKNAMGSEFIIGNDCLVSTIYTYYDIMGKYIEYDDSLYYPLSDQERVDNKYYELLPYDFIFITKNGDIYIMPEEEFNKKYEKIPTKKSTKHKPKPKSKSSTHKKEATQYNDHSN